MDRNNASVIIGATPISAWIISWGTDALLLIMRAIIDTKGFSKSFQWFALLRLGPHVSTLQRRVGVTSVSNNHSLTVARGIANVHIVPREHQGLHIHEKIRHKQPLNNLDILLQECDLRYGLELLDDGSSPWYPSTWWLAWESRTCGWCLICFHTLQKGSWHRSLELLDDMWIMKHMYDGSCATIDCHWVIDLEVWDFMMMACSCRYVAGCYRMVSLAWTLVW